MRNAWWFAAFNGLSFQIVLGSPMILYAKTLNANATVLGIIPSTFIYSSIGAGLGHVFDRGDTPDMRMMADPQVYLPLAGLALLSTGPLAFHAWRARRRRREALTNAAE